MRIEARLQQHELAVARHQEIDHLRVAVAGRDPLAHQQPQVARQRRLGIVDRLVLAHHAAQFARQIARPRFLGRIGHDLVGLHGICGRRCHQHGQRQTRRRGMCFNGITPPPAIAREAFAGFGAPTRSRRSDSDSMPPNAISTGPHQISSTSGL